MTTISGPDRSPPTRTELDPDSAGDAKPSERNPQDFAGTAGEGVIAHTIDADATSIERGGELGPEPVHPADEVRGGFDGHQ